MKKISFIKGEIHYLEAGKNYVSEFTIGPGGLFGEMSLFSGMPRTATVKTMEESVLLKIDALTFANVLNRNPELAEKIAGTVSLRNQKNKEFFQKIKDLSREDIERSTNSHFILSWLKKLMSRK
ncbi:MAG: Crp/Fnr family transcriptional regulator [Acidobacteriota bacterium]